MRGIPDHADFRWDYTGENFLLQPLTLRAVEWLQQNCQNYAIEATPHGFIARPVVIFENRAEWVLEKIRAAGLRV